MSNPIEKVNHLTQEQRDTALHQARLRIAGDRPEPGVEPDLESFLAHASGRYPPSVTRTIRALSLITLAAAFLPSAIRLHSLGVTEFARSIADVPSTYVAALCIVLLSESGQLIFSLAAATLADTGSRINWQRWGLRFGAFTCTLIALAGNAEVVQPWNQPGLFVWLEAFAPPLLVLVTAQVLKTQTMHSIEDRHLAQQQFIEAHAAWVADYEVRLRAWQDAYDNAHLDADWQRTVANALRDALRAANRRSHAVMRELTNTEWYELIHRELRADQWYVMADTQVRQQQRTQEEAAERAPMRAASGATAGTHTGELDGTVREVNGAFVASCPHCDRTFENATRRGAKNALVAHVRHAHRNPEPALQPVRVPADDTVLVEANVNGRA